MQKSLRCWPCPSGESLKLRSAVTGTPIRDHPGAAVLGGPFGSEHKARIAAEKSKLAILYWGIEQRVGIDFGDGKQGSFGGQRSFATNAFLELLQQQHGCPVRNDVHGIDIYEPVDGLRFVRVEIGAVGRKNPCKFIQTIRREYRQPRQLTEKQVLACEMYLSSFFDVSDRSRFITLYTAVEALLEPSKRTQEVRDLIESLKKMVKESPIDKGTKESMMGTVGRLDFESISQAGCTLANQLMGVELFEGRKGEVFWKKCHKLRNAIVHGRGVEPCVDILHFANSMQSFVARLLRASLQRSERCVDRAPIAWREPP